MFNKVKNLFNKMPKSLVALIAVVLFVAIPVAVFAGFGPERPTYDYNKFAEGVSCTDPSQAFGRCGSMDGPVFNSFVNTPTYGDERNFNRIAEVVPGQSPVEADFGETKTATPGKEYWVRTFVHNNANQNTNGADFNHIGVAHNTRIRVAIADGVANGIDVMSYISASNAKQQTVWDSSTLANNNQAFSVSYVPGSAVVYNHAHQGGMAISDDIMSANGTPFGFDQMNGDLPGCFEFSAYVYVKVTAKAPTLAVNKTTRVSGNENGDWHDSITAKKSDTIDWKIEFANRGNDIAHDVTIRDTLPKGVSLVPGSIKWYDANHNGEVLQDTALGSGGVDLGNYAPAGDDINGAITFKTTINNDFKECELKNVAYGRASNIPETSDDSKVVIENCNPVNPVVSCDSLTAQSLGDRKFSYTVRYTARNASLKTIAYDFGDSTNPLVTNNTTVEHTYVKDGEYTTRAVLTFVVNGHDQVVRSNNCMTTVNTTTPKNNCTIPGKENFPANSPECSLPNTGIGNIFGIFTATTVAGAAAHYVFSSLRRFNV